MLREPIWVVEAGMMINVIINPQIQRSLTLYQIELTSSSIGNIDIIIKINKVENKSIGLSSLNAREWQEKY